MNTSSGLKGHSVGAAGSKDGWIVASLPKNSYGKVLKRELRQTLPPITGASTRPT